MQRITPYKVIVRFLRRGGACQVRQIEFLVLASSHETARGLACARVQRVLPDEVIEGATLEEAWAKA